MAVFRKNPGREVIPRESESWSWSEIQKKERDRRKREQDTEKTPDTATLPEGKMEFDNGDGTKIQPIELEKWRKRDAESGAIKEAYARQLRRQEQSLKDWRARRSARVERTREEGEVGDGVES